MNSSAWSWLTWVSVTLLVFLALGINYSLVLAYRDVFLDLYQFNDDERQFLSPFVSASGGGESNYSDVYYRTALMPLGVRFFYALATSLHFMPYAGDFLFAVLFFTLLIAFGLLGWEVGGFLGSFVAIFLCITSDLFLDRMAGGLPRSFAYPLVVFGLLFLLKNRWYLLSLVTVFAAMFYPAAAFINGVFLVGGIYLFRNRVRSVVPLLFLTLFTVLLCVFFITPLVFGGFVYGARISQYDVVRFPEAGLGGRYTPEHVFPFPSFIALSLDYFMRTLSLQRYFVVLVLVLMVGFWSWVGFFNPQSRLFVRKLLFLLFVLGLTYVVSLVGYPYFFFPPRYVTYLLPCIVLLALSAMVGVVWFSGLSKYFRATFFVFFVVLVFVFRFSHQPALAVGYTLDVSRERPLYEFIRALPSDELLAGWPDGVIDNVPYLTGHRALITFETHQAYHQGYLLEMRRRMRDLVRAYFAVDRADLLTLRDRWNVRYLIVDVRHYTSEGQPSYFAPFADEVVTFAVRARQEGPVVMQLGEPFLIFDYGPFRVFDLGKL